VEVYDLKRLGYQFDYIFTGNLLVAGLLHRVLEQTQAVGAGYSQHPGPGLGCLPGLDLGKAILGQGLHPDPPSAAPTAHGRLPVRGELRRFEAGNGRQGLPGLLVYLLVATQVAGIVVDYLGRLFIAELEPSLGQQAGQQLSVVDHLEIGIELAIVVREGGMAMGRDGEYLLDPLLPPQLDILLRQALEKFLIADLGYRLATAALLGSDDTIADPGSLQYLDQGSGHLLAPGVVVVGAAKG